ncbi:MAG TPA: glycosyltransferase [Puia sp.]|uniref:glycosyltransferase n=1 Tax=Puia sp. TaxID=2045100 RepID=UPI002BE6B687|nr:glycosyltransferase [Puia sp.]HVU98941.1 glycosyltransferase [Puia sp.]
MKKICIVSDLHLSSNPRVWKEANTLAAAGYDVTILTMWTSAAKRDSDKTLLHHPAIKYKAGLNLIPGEIAPWRRLCYRLRGRLEREAHRLFKTNTPWTLGYAPGRLTALALKEHADLYIAHTEYGIIIGNRLLEKGRRVAFDVEDWYSRDYLVASRPVKLLESAEQKALTHGVYVTCPSRAMSAAMQAIYKGTSAAEVIYNGFPLAESARAPQSGPAAPSLIWFSQTIGPGRGLETLLEALKLTRTPLEIHFVGECVTGYDKQLQAAFPEDKGHQLIIHPAVKHTQLPDLIAKHRIGLAIEQSQPESRNKTITNKLLQYLQAGIQVLATITDGQKEVAAQFPGAVQLVPQDDPAAWAAGLESLLTRKVDRESTRRTFDMEFSWEAQEKKLLGLVEKALNQSR